MCVCVCSLNKRHSYIYIGNGHGHGRVFPSAIPFYTDGRMRFEAYGFKVAQHFSHGAYFDFNESCRFKLNHNEV